MERQQAEAERLSYQLELSRLQQQQQRIGQPFVSSQSHPHHYPHPATSRTYVLGGRDNNGTAQLFPAFASGLNGGVGVNSKGAGAQPGRQAKGWLNPLGYIDYWFGDSTGSSGGAAAGGSGETIIIKV